MSITDQLIANNRAFADGAADRAAPAPGGPGVAVVACMDARMDIYAILGLRPGQAHVIRNAGGVITDDEIRSLAISQRLLGTKEILLIHHTDCGMLAIAEDEFMAELEADAGIRPSWSTEAFADLDDDVLRSMARVRESPFIPRRDAVRGFVYNLETGLLREVDAG